MKNQNFKELIGKTILGIEKVNNPDFPDDEGFLIVSFTDGSRYTIIAEFAACDSSLRSEEEYPTRIYLQFGDFRDLSSTRQIVSPQFPIG